MKEFRIEVFANYPTSDRYGYYQMFEAWTEINGEWRLTAVHLTDPHLSETYHGSLKISITEIPMPDIPINAYFKTVKAETGYAAIKKFQEWLDTGKPESWLLEVGK